MSKNVGCPACLALEKGIRSRIPFKHTCGQEPKALTRGGADIQTFEEIKDSYLDNPLLNIKQKLELLDVKDMKTLVTKIDEFLKEDPHEFSNGL